MTKEGQLLAALSYLQAAYSAALKAALLIEDKTAATEIHECGETLCSYYLAIETETLKPRQKAGENPPSTISP